MRLEYIKANGIYYRPQKAGVQDTDKIEGCLLLVCFIKKLFFGRWQIDYYDDGLYVYKSSYDNQKPASRLILYPSAIELIKYTEETYFE
jgi:hypothetical protein